MADLYERSHRRTAYTKTYSVPGARIAGRCQNKELADRFPRVPRLHDDSDGVRSTTRCRASCAAQPRDKVLERNRAIVTKQPGHRSRGGYQRAARVLSAPEPCPRRSSSWISRSIRMSGSADRPLRDQGVLGCASRRAAFCGARLGYCALPTTLREGPQAPEPPRASQFDET